MFCQSKHFQADQQVGFTLFEMAVVMVILALLLGGLFAPIATQRDLANRAKTEDQLALIRDALVGFAMRQTPARLPCPATAASSGIEAPVGGGSCTTDHGFVPAQTLGITGEVNASGQLLDAWNQPIYYSVHDTGANEYTTNIQLSSPTPAFRVCQQDTCPANSELVDQGLFVIFSTANDLTASNLQQENLDGDNDFIFTTISEGVGSEFDDLVIWYATPALFAQLVKAGKLP